MPSVTARWFAATLILATFASLAAAEESTAEKPLTAADARQHVGEKVWVKATIKTTKDRLEKRGEIYLDTELDFRDPANLAIVVNRDGARSLREKGIADAAEHFRDKTVLVQGTVALQDDVPRIVIDQADQIRIVEN